MTPLKWITPIEMQQQNCINTAKKSNAQVYTNHWTIHSTAMYNKCGLCSICIWVPYCETSNSSARLSERTLAQSGLIQSLSLRLQFLWTKLRIQYHYNLIYVWCNVYLDIFSRRITQLVATYRVTSCLSVWTSSSFSLQLQHVLEEASDCTL